MLEEDCHQRRGKSKMKVSLYYPCKISKQERRAKRDVDGMYISAIVEIV